MEEKYAEESLYEVMKFWADAYIYPKQKISKFEYFIDTRKGKVIFKFNLENIESGDSE